MSRPDAGLSAVVVEGEPGIGKTRLWEAGVALAGEHDLRVLAARASDAETGWAFTALIDLLDGVTSDELAALPAPQRGALDVALYRAEPTDAPPDRHAIAVGLLSALRVLAGRDRLLVAIDDLQWLDRQSEEALAYAVRRLDGEPVTFLLARRPGHGSTVESALPADRAQRLRLTPSSLGATRQILADRLGLRLPHHLLRRVFDITLGNPLFSLEVGRMLSGRRLDGLGAELPIPDDVEDLLGTRVADLGGSGRRLLQTLALDADLRVDQLLRVAGERALEDAADSVVVQGDRVRASHPLLAAAAIRQAGVVERDELHRLLADVVVDDQRRSLHLALATHSPDEALATRLAAAAETAAARGGTLSAVELATHALRLSPTESPATTSRVLRLAEHLSVAGEKQRLTELLDARLTSLPRGGPRVAAYVLLTNGVIDGNDDIRRLLEQALAEAGDQEELRAPVLALLAENEAVIKVANVAQAEQWATEALTSSAGRPEDERLALYTLAWARSLRGQEIAELCERHRAVSADRFFLAQSPDRVAGQRHVWRGEVERARAAIGALRELAEERAEPSPYALQRLHLCELELRVGGWNEAERLLDEWAESTDSELLHWPMYERCRALLAAGRGDTTEARRWGADAVARSETTGVRWDWLEGQRALGLAALLTKDFTTAVEHLGLVWQHTEREGVLDPGTFPAAPDLVEALVEAGEPDSARAVAVRLADLSDEQDHPWGKAGAQRSAALIRLAAGYSDAPAEALGEAATTYRELRLRFDEGRTLLLVGRAERRARKWGAARDHLERAIDAFEAEGSSGWADDARSELARVGARRPSTAGRLTVTEQRTARLAADGLSNKEIAKVLVVTVNTVEFHLRNTYAKLGIRSRAQLAGRLTEADTEPGR